jgi:hypothetical protein
MGRAMDIRRQLLSIQFRVKHLGRVRKAAMVSEVGFKADPAHFRSPPLLCAATRRRRPQNLRGRRDEAGRTAPL